MGPKINIFKNKERIFVILFFLIFLMFGLCVFDDYGYSIDAMVRDYGNGCGVLCGAF